VGTAAPLRRQLGHQHTSHSVPGSSDAISLPITVCHLPPGTSKWNKIEHRLFSFITIN
jgi:hypothetical protein